MGGGGGGGKGGAVREREDRAYMSFSMRLIYSFHNYLKKKRKNFLLNLIEYANGGVICTFPILKGGYYLIQYIKGGLKLTQ
jgi:hypothetical protein